MDTDMKAQLRLLRKSIPIGITEGLALLEKYQGDTKKVQKVWLDQVLDAIVAETGAPRETAKIYFVGHLFDQKEAVKQLKKVFES